ncbi:blastula protease 10-like [Hydractinia symbiolongicarpus]|uniref:blastula protease 10-like n=1 Tax=Hydractinia symbiolongicarpus TaxID=13093 RepID=UPI00254CCECF|nr:blastula protease 10-like [Hydractinia symbiolongicarpus]
MATGALTLRLQGKSANTPSPSDLYKKVTANMKSQGLLVIIFIAFGSVSCHYLNDMLDEFRRKRYDETDENNEIENDSTNSIDIATINGKLKKKPVGQHKGDHLAHEDIMFQKGEEEAVFGTKSSRDEESSEGAAKDAIVETHKRWTLPVPYQIDGSLGSTARSAISSAISDYGSKTCITFRPRRSGDTSYLSFFKGDGCWSYVGRKGGEQQVSLGSGCEHKATAIHEIMHALGFWHEQSRTDRDNYVQILLHNIQQGSHLEKL